MKLTELLEQCESENSAVCLLAKQRLRYHAAEVLPELVRRLRIISESKSLTVAGIRSIAVGGLRLSEEVKDHSEQLNEQPKTVTIMP